MSILSVAFERSSDGLLLLVNGQFVDCNPAAITLLGCTDKTEVIGKSPADFSPPHQPNGSRSDMQAHVMIAQAVAQGSARFEWTHQRTDGELLPVEVLLTAVQHDGQTVVHVNWRDIRRRRATEQALAHRRMLESLMRGFSSRFINLPTEDIDDGIQRALGELGVFVGADRSYVFAYAGGAMFNRYEWCADGVPPQIDRMQQVPIDAMPWSNKRILRGEILNTPCVDDLPPAAQAEKDEFAVQSIQSVLVVPMERRGEVVGFIGFDAVRRHRDWPDKVVDLLRLAAGIIANVLDRRDAELQLREANATLEQKVQARTEQLEHRWQVAESLRGTLAIMNSHQSLADTLDHLVRQAVDLTDAAACTLYTLDTEAQTGRIEASANIFEDDVRRLEFDLSSTSGEELLSIIQGRQMMTFIIDPAQIETIRTDTNVSRDVRDRRAMVYEQFSSALSVPLFIRDEPFGAIMLYYKTQRSFNNQQVQTVMTLAEQAALAVENARLHQAEQKRRTEAEQRRRVAEGLREGLAVLNSNRTLDDILDFIVGQAVDLLGTTGGALYLLDEERDMLHIGASHGLDTAYTSLEIPVGEAITGRAVALGEPVAVPDMQQALPLLENYLSAPDIPPGWTDGLKWLTRHYHAVLAVPVRTQSQTYGSLTLYYPTPQQFTDEVIGLAVAFAGQAALVIENARLRERVRETATIEERNRLARDLHDAVTQTLFSASIIADTVPELWEIDRTDAEAQLQQLGRLTRGALAEMRSLLIELRPARLIEADLHTLLQQLVDAADGRTKVDITLKVQGSCVPPPDVKIVLYRITQEALNNIVKHAGARHAFVSLRCDPRRVTLQVLDDGRGFDIDAIKGGHFGVQIMGERAASVGADFVIETAPGEGTEIQLTWRQQT